MRILTELYGYTRTQMSYLLLPMLLIVLMVAVLIFLRPPAVGPFIFTVF